MPVQSHICHWESSLARELDHNNDMQDKVMQAALSERKETFEQLTVRHLVKIISVLYNNFAYVLEKASPLYRKNWGTQRLLETPQNIRRWPKQLQDYKKLWMPSSMPAKLNRALRMPGRCSRIPQVSSIPREQD